MREDRRDRFMLLAPERTLYVGLHGEPVARMMGGATIYVSLTGTAEIEIAGGPSQSGEISIVPAFTEHSVRAEDRSVATLVLEPESIGPDALRRLYGLGPSELGLLARRVRDVCATGGAAFGSGFTTDAFDDELFGAPLGTRSLDPRISAIVAGFARAPTRRVSGEQCARAANLSLSRFLHLFKAETGITFKTFRAWKRGRAVLDHANRKVNLAHLALDMGYPDSTHFSHSVRRIYGLAPSAIFSGSRRLRILRDRPGSEPILLPGR